MYHTTKDMKSTLNNKPDSVIIKNTFYEKVINFRITNSVEFMLIQA